MIGGFFEDGTKAKTPSEINPSFIGVTDVPGFEILTQNVTTLKFGEMVSGVVERQTAHFYKINVSESDMKNGIIVNCVSNGGDKFKVVFFDKVCLFLGMFYSDKFKLCR